MEPRLKSDFWVSALLRRAQGAGAAAFVVRRGDGDAGAVLLKLNLLGGGFRVLSLSRRRDGQRVWLALTGPGPVAETDADARIARQTGVDPDLWVVEIEDRQGRAFVDDPVE